MKEIFLEGPYKQKTLKHTPAFTMGNTMASPGLQKKVHLPQFILAMDGTIGCVKRGT